ncbi:hypothetical protein TUM17564_09640 [Citrobacter freundii]|nr:hypothetical protein TUM17564_09640 [Citrobacter freundii]
MDELKMVRPAQFYLNVFLIFSTKKMLNVERVITNGQVRPFYALALLQSVV